MKDINPYNEEAVQPAVNKGIEGMSLDQLVEQYTPLVKRIAHHLTGRMPSSVSPQDMIQSGMIGLIEAAQKYDGSKGASFETYAGIRIRGSMLDEIRRGDWAPRSVHRNTRRVSDAIRAIENRTGRDAKDTDVAEELGISIDDYYKMLNDTMSAKLFSFNELIGQDENIAIAKEDGDYRAGPFNGIAKQALFTQLVKEIANLPDREKMVLALYYDEELNLKEIGEVLGVSESRVSQIHSQAASRLRARMQDWQLDDR